MSDLRAKFAPGDRVAALAGTEYDDLDGFTETELAYAKLHGHHGRVVEGCDKICDSAVAIHVRWEGVHDGRSLGPTYWTDGEVWHMYDDEIEHID